MTDREAIEAIEIVLGSDYNYDETIGYQLTSDDFEWMEMAKVALQEHIDREKGCRCCFDASVDPELEGCDLSYHDVGDAQRYKRIMVRSGGGKPMILMFEEWSGQQWNTVGIYEPKFCPECGRPLKGAQDEAKI